MNSPSDASALALHVEAQGSGPVVVLAHGFAGSARNFRPQQRALAARFRVVCFDARGHARSPAPDDPSLYDEACFVADLARVLDQQGAARAVVGGLSMGAAVALRFALAHRERVRGLVLASHPADPGGGGGVVGAAAAAFADAIEREGLEAAGARFVWGAASGLDARGAALVRQGFLEHSPHGLVHTLRGLLARLASIEALAPALAALRLPALLIAGAADRPSLEASRRLAALLPAARLVVIEGAGHVVNLAAPAAFLAALEPFLDALPD